MTAGFDAALAAVRRRKTVAVFVACDISEKTLKEWAFQTKDHPTQPTHLALTKEALGAALGARGPVGLVAVSDEGFANAIRAVCPTTKEEKL